MIGRGVKSGQKTKRGIGKKLGKFYRQFKKTGPKVFSKNSAAISKRKGNRRFLTILGNMGIVAIFQNSGGGLTLTNGCWET